MGVRYFVNKNLLEEFIISKFPKNTEGFFVFKNELLIECKAFSVRTSSEFIQYKISPSASSKPFFIASDWPLSSQLISAKCKIYIFEEFGACYL